MMTESYTELVEVTATIYNAGDTENTDYLNDSDGAVWAIEGEPRFVDDALADGEEGGENSTFTKEAVRFTFRPIANPGYMGDPFTSLIEIEIDSVSAADTFEGFLSELVIIAKRRAANGPELAPVRFIAVFSVGSFSQRDDEGFKDYWTEIELLGELDFAKLEDAIVKVQA